jgi:hypothetical protein
MCNNALVHWRSKFASILATSTTEAELISAASFDLQDLDLLI